MGGRCCTGKMLTIASCVYCSFFASRSFLLLSFLQTYQDVSAEMLASSVGWEGATASNLLVMCMRTKWLRRSSWCRNRKLRRTMTSSPAVVSIIPMVPRPISLGHRQPRRFQQAKFGTCCQGLIPCRCFGESGRGRRVLVLSFSPDCHGRSCSLPQRMEDPFWTQNSSSDVDSWLHENS